MLRPEKTRRQSFVFWIRTTFLLALICSTAAVVETQFSDLIRGADFPDFYCAARMLLDGHGHQLYDPDLQRQYQAAYSGRIGTLYIHPPFEVVLYLAVAWLPLRRAYLLWSLLNLAALAVGVRRLARGALPQWNWQVLLAASLTFVPLLLCLLQGQDSLLLLSLASFAFTDLRRHRAFAAGCWLGLGLFKFQLILPLVLVLVLTQSRSGRGALAKGFSLVALALAGLSAAISGWSVFRVYPKFLIHLQAQPFAGIVPQAMANFRGLTYFVSRSDQSSWAIGIVFILSTAALIKTLTVWRRLANMSDPNPATQGRDQFDLAFASAMLFSLLVSYHLNPHDLSLLLLPMSVLLHRSLVGTQLQASKNWMTLSLIAILFLPPLHLWALKARVYALVAVPMLVLFLSNESLTQQSKPSPSIQHIHKD